MSSMIAKGMCIIVGVLAALFLFEGISVMPHTEYCDAVVVATSPGGVTGWSNNNRTIVKYSDGVVEEQHGLLDAVGDKIRALRTYGTSTVFGILGDYTSRESKRLWKASIKR